MYIVKLHIIPKDDQKKKKKLKTFLSASERLHWIPPQSFPEYHKYWECFQLNNPGEDVQYFTMPDSRQNTNRTDSYAFVGGKKRDET